MRPLFAVSVEVRVPVSFEMSELLNKRDFSTIVGLCDSRTVGVLAMGIHVMHQFTGCVDE
jgi:hypothetical protein